MKSFHQFITEAKEIKDVEGLGSGTGLTHRGGDKIGSERKKTDAEKKRVKAIGGGKTAPAKSYKPRKDIGTQRPKGRASERQQQPTRERGSAALSPKEAQRKAAMERRAAKSGAKTKTADELLSKKKKTVSPKYKPTGKPGHTGTSKRQYTTPERQKLQRAGDRLVKDIQKKKEKPAASYDPKIS